MKSTFLESSMSFSYKVKMWKILVKVSSRHKIKQNEITKCLAAGII